MSVSDLFSAMFGGGGGGYTSGDGLVNLPGLSREDALNGFRSVLDFRHLYGPNTKVPNINFGGQVMSGKLPDSALDSPQAMMPGPMGNVSSPMDPINQGPGSAPTNFGAMGGGGPSKLSQGLGAFGQALGGHGQAGEVHGAPKQQDNGGFHRLLEQLMADQRPQSQGYGGRYANYLTHNL